MSDGILGSIRSRTRGRDLDASELELEASASLIAGSAGLGEEGFAEIRADLAGKGREAFRKTSRRIREEWNDDRVRLAIWIHPGFLVSQLLPIAQACAADPRFHLAAVITGRWEPSQIERFSWFLDRPFLHAPDPSWLSELEFFQVMVGGEDKIDSSGFPRGVRRVLQPHGMDVPLHNSILSYGAGVVYDYVLCPSLGPHLQSNLDPALYRGLFPPDMVEHGSAELVAIPAGYPKLDRFLKAARNHAGTPSDIAYHLSNWGLEAPFVHDHARGIVQSLLDAFPERKVVLRPMPKDQEHPEIRALIEAFRGNPRLVVSRAESYVEDYLEAALLVHHRSSSADVFAMATGRPVLLVAPPDNSPASNEFGTVVRGHAGVAEAARKLLADAEAFRGGNLSKQAKLLSNPGCSTEYVLDCLVAIAHGHRLPNWTSLPLFPVQTAGSMPDRFLQSGMKALGAGIQYRSMAREMARRFPESWTFSFLASVGLKRSGHPAFYLENALYWLESLEVFARCFRTALDIPPGLDLRTLYADWMAKDVPEMITLVEAWIRSTGSSDHRLRLERCLAAIPILSGDGSVAQAIWSKESEKRRIEGTKDRAIAQLQAEVANLRLSSGVEALERGDAAQAMEHFSRSKDLAPEEAAPWMGLAHCALALKDLPAFRESARQLEKRPDGQAVLAEIQARGREVFGASAL